MARIPEYTQQVYLDRANPANIEYARAIEGGNNADKILRDNRDFQQNVGQALSGADQYMRKIEAQKDVSRKLKAQEQYNQKEREFIDFSNSLQQEKMKNPEGYANAIDKWFTDADAQFQTSLAGKKPDELDVDAEYFRQNLDKKRTQAKASALDWENGVRVQNTAVSLENAADQMIVNFSMSRPSFAQLPAALDKAKEMINTVGGKTLSEPQNNKYAQYVFDGLTKSAMQSQIEDNPDALNYLMNYGGGSSEQIIDFVIHGLEGGAAVVKDGKGIAKFGVNSAANPDIDVAGLDLASAVNVYKSRYWDERLEKFPPQFQAVAFDALVNHGNDKDTWKMIGDANGSAYALLEARKKEYDRLVTQDPEQYGKNKKGWENRLKKLSDYVTTLDDQGEAFKKVIPLMSPDTLAKAKSIIPDAIEAKNRALEIQKKIKVSAFETQFKGLNDELQRSLKPLGAQELNGALELAAVTGDEEMIAKAKALQDMSVYVGTLRGKSDKDLQKDLRAIQASVNKEPTAENRFQLETIQGVLEKGRAAKKESGLDYFYEIGTARQPQEINYSNVAEARAELALREKDVDTIREKMGEYTPVLKPQEIEELKNEFDGLPSDRISVDDFASRLSAFDALNPLYKQDVARRISEKSNVLAGAFSVDDPAARRAILRGAKVGVGYKKADYDAEINALMSEMSLDASARELVSETIEAHYKALLLDTKKEMDIDVNPKQIKKSVEAVMGPVVDLSINDSKVFSFRDDSGQFVAEDDLYDLFNGLDENILRKAVGKDVIDLKSSTLTKNEIQEEVRFVSVGNGLYSMIFDRTGEYIPDPQNATRRLVLDGRELLKAYKKAKK